MIKHSQEAIYFVVRYNYDLNKIILFALLFYLDIVEVFLLVFRYMRYIIDYIHGQKVRLSMVICV